MGCPLAPPFFSSPTLNLFFLPSSVYRIFLPLVISSEFSCAGVCTLSSPHCPLFNNWEVSQPRAFCYRQEVHSVASLHHPRGLKEAPSKSSLGILLSQTNHGSQSNTVCWPGSILLYFPRSHCPLLPSLLKKGPAGRGCWR